MTFYLDNWLQTLYKTSTECHEVAHQLILNRSNDVYFKHVISKNKTQKGLQLQENIQQQFDALQCERLLPP